MIGCFGCCAAAAPCAAADARAGGLSALGVITACVLLERNTLAEEVGGVPKSAGLALAGAPGFLNGSVLDGAASTGGALASAADFFSRGAAPNESAAPNEGAAPKEGAAPNDGRPTVALSDVGSLLLPAAAASAPRSPLNGAGVVAEGASVGLLLEAGAIGENPKRADGAALEAGVADVPAAPEVRLGACAGGVEALAVVAVAGAVGATGVEAPAGAAEPDDTLPNEPKNEPAAGGVATAAVGALKSALGALDAAADVGPGNAAEEPAGLLTAAPTPRPIEGPPKPANMLLPVLLAENDSELAAGAPKARAVAGDLAASAVVAALVAAGAVAGAPKPKPDPKEKPPAAVAAAGGLKVLALGKADASADVLGVLAAAVVAVAASDAAEGAGERAGAGAELGAGSAATAAHMNGYGAEAR